MRDLVAKTPKIIQRLRARSNHAERRRIADPDGLALRRANDVGRSAYGQSWMIDRPPDVQSPVRHRFIR